MNEKRDKNKIDPLLGFAPILEVFSMFGLWPKEQFNKNRYTIYAIFIQFCCTYLCAITLVAKLSEVTNVINSMEYIFIVLSEITYILKVTGLIYNRKKFVSILKMMTEKLTIESYDEIEKVMILRGIRRAKRIYYLLLTNFMIAVFVALINVLLKKERTLLFHAAFPYDYRSNMFLYVLTVSYQYFAVTIQTFTIAGLDAIPSALIVVINGYCEVLGHNLSKLGHYQNLNVKKEKLNEQVNIKKLAMKYCDLQK